MKTVLKSLLKNRALIGVAIAFIAEQLATLVQNPDSALIDAVEVLHDSAHEFLSAVGRTPR